MTTAFTNSSLIGTKGIGSAPIITGINTVVPNDFLGFHMGRAVYDSTYLITSGVDSGTPYMNKIPSLGVSYGWVRTHDSLATSWRNIHTSAGVFNSTELAKLDIYINYWYGQGKKILYTLYSTPAWAADTTVNFTDQYGSQYGASPVNDLTSSGSVTVAAYITMLMNRYNAGSTKKIAAIEVWNEPQFSGGVNSADYYIGTPAQLARTSKAIYQAAKAIDSSVIIVSPSIVGGYMDKWASGIVGDGTTAGNWCDYVGYHHYDFSIYAAQEHSQFILSDYVGLIIKYKKDLATAGINKPLFQTEAGWLTPAVFQLWSDAKKANYIKCLGLLTAASGARACIYYLVDGNYFTGTDGSVNPGYSANNLIFGPLVNTTVKSAYQWVSDLSGKTITEVGYCNGTLGLYAKLSDDSVITTN